jgi:hypothetical protein
MRELESVVARATIERIALEQEALQSNSTVMALATDTSRQNDLHDFVAGLK